MVTQAEIAKLAGVDRTSVSKILCGRQPEFYSDEVVARVKDAAARLGYRHRNFRGALNIAYLLPVAEDRGRDGLHDVAERTMGTLLGMNAALRGSKHRIHILDIDSSDKLFDLDAVVNGSDAFVVWGPGNGWADELLAGIRRSGKDHVSIGNVADPGQHQGSYVLNSSLETYVDNAVGVLSRYGHRDIAGVVPRVSRQNRSIVKRVYEKHGLTFADENLLACGFTNAVGCAETARRIVERKHRAVFVQLNDISALELVIELGKLGIRVPEDISVLGNHKKRSLPCLGIDLSSFESPWFEMGRRAAEILVANAARSDCERRVVQEVLKQRYYDGNTIATITQGAK